MSQTSSQLSLMPEAPKKKNSLSQFILIFAVVYLGSQVIMRVFFPAQFGGDTNVAPLTLTTGNITTGHHPILTVANHTASGIILQDRCPSAPVDVYMVNAPGTPQEKLTPLASTENAVPCVPPVAIGPGSSQQISLAPWKYSIFGQNGTYEVRLPVKATKTASGSSASSKALSGSSAVVPVTASGVTVAGPLVARFTISEPGFFTKLFRTFITQPFLNALIFIASLIPDHNLAIAIIILTLIVKIILFFPTQHAMEGQKKMQLIQPRIEELKKKYPNDAVKQQEETMKLWKEYKINPVQSCLPTLIQFPILIGLYYTIRDGSTLALSKHLIYSFYQHLDWSFNTHFLGFDLLKPSVYVLPIMLVVLQYLQMRLTFAINDRKQNKQKVIDAATGKPEKEALSSAKLQQQLMMYGLPLMIGFIAFRSPAAVAIYWGVSTAFAIGQQMIVNREHIRV